VCCRPAGTIKEESKRDVTKSGYLVDGTAATVYRCITATSLQVDLGKAGCSLEGSQL
jgi:hypothetical protein